MAINQIILIYGVYIKNENDTKSLVVMIRLSQANSQVVGHVVGRRFKSHNENILTLV
jgi:hypothetical protein